MKLFIYALLLCTLFGCEPQRHCDHHFVYQGNIFRTTSRHTHRDYKLCFTNLGDIVFKDDSGIMTDTLLIDGDVDYEYKGSFYSLCESDEVVFEKTDQIEYRLIYGNEVISSGRFNMESLKHQYVDSTHTIILQIPTIEIPRIY